MAGYLDGEDLCLTYGDGVSDLDIARLIAFHREEAVLATVTAVQPPGRWGAMQLDGKRVRGIRWGPTRPTSWAPSMCSRRLV